MSNPDQHTLSELCVLADLPGPVRPRVSIMTGKTLSAFIDKIRHEKAADFSVCDVVVPVRIE